MNMVRLLVLGLGFAGSLLFTAAFIASWTSEHFISQAAREVIRYRVAEEINEKIDALGADFLVEKAKIALKEKAQEIDQLKLILKSKVPELVAAVANQMADPNCPCRKWAPESFRNFVLALLTDATQAQNRLTDLIKTKYLEVEAQLTREFRIFTGTNALACLLLVLATLFKTGARIHLLPPALILLIATGVTSYFYLFNQDWLHTIVFGDYVGLAYAAYLVFVFACLVDIVLNRARITVAVVDGVFGGLFSLSPC